jgi:hypothetical protein
MTFPITSSNEAIITFSAPRIRTAGLLFLVMFGCAASSLNAQVLVSENFSGYTNGNLVGQNSWVAYSSSITTSPIVANSITPPSGGKYLEDGQTSNVDTRARKDYSLSLLSNSVITMSFDLNVGSGTYNFGLMDSSVAQGPLIGYSGGIYVANAGGNSFAKTSSNTNVTIANGNWIRITSTADFGNDTMSLSYQLWNDSAWGASQVLYFDQAQSVSTVSMTNDPTIYESVFLRMANNTTGQMTNLNVTLVPEPGSAVLFGLGLTGLMLIRGRIRMKRLG